MIQLYFFLVNQLSDFYFIISGDEKTYLSLDTPCQSDKDQEIQDE